MFLTGNKPPPASFANEEHFREFVRSKEYRAVLGVSNVYTSFNAEGRSTGSSTHDSEIVGGYTPLGIQVGTRNLYATFRMYSVGEVTAASSIAFGTDEAPIGKSVNFRVGKPMNWGFKRLTGHYLPYAAMDFSYTIRGDGECKVDLNSTSIPNITIYKNWNAAGHYRLWDITAEELDDFVTADSRSEFPHKALRFTITDSLTRIT